jgi:hypothetical protein
MASRKRPEPTPARSIEELEAVAKKMRELGVTEYDGIKLGPAPVDAPRRLTPKEEVQKALDAEAKKRDIMFAASSVRPRLRKAADS